jgi:hypothetical protein
MDEDFVSLEIDVVGGQTISCRMAGSWVREQVHWPAHRPVTDEREKLLTMVYNYLLTVLKPDKSDVPFVANDGKRTWIVPTRNILAVRFDDPRPGTGRSLGFRPVDSAD